MKIFFLFFLLIPFTKATPQVAPKDGTYKYTFCQAEYPGGYCKGTVEVIITNGKITVTSLDTFMKKGKVIDQGMLILHTSGRWIIGKNPKDAELKEIGGCSGGPNTIDFANLKYWTC